MLNVYKQDASSGRSQSWKLVQHALNSSYFELFRLFKEQFTNRKELKLSEMSCL